MRGILIRLAVVLAVLAVVQQFAIPPYLEHRVADRLTADGGTAHVRMRAFPSARLLFGSGRSLDVHASGLSLDLVSGKRNIFERLGDFSHVQIAITNSRAGPFTVHAFRLERMRRDEYAAAVAADATAGDVARYAGEQLGGDFGAALAGLATSAVAGFDRPVPVDATMLIDASRRPPRATDVNGDLAGLPAGPLAGIVANTLLAALA